MNQLITLEVLRPCKLDLKSINNNFLQLIINCCVGCQELLVVLHIKVYRVSGHRLLCSKKEEPKYFLVARISSQHHAIFIVFWSKICAGRTRNVLWFSEHLCAYNHVQLLFTSWTRTSVSEVFVVEKVFNGKLTQN